MASLLLHHELNRCRALLSHHHSGDASHVVTVQRGHADPRMAIRYRQAARGRGAEIARRLSGLAPFTTE